MTVPVFVDTNVLVYRMQARSSKMESATAWIERLWRDGTARTSFQVLNEYYSVVTGRLQPSLPRARAREHLQWLFAWDPLAIDTRAIRTAWRIQDTASVSWWDALIVAAAAIQGCRFLLTEDLQHGQEISGVTVVDPFRAVPEAILGS